MGFFCFFGVRFFFSPPKPFMYWSRSSRELFKNCTVCLSWYVEGRIVCFLLLCFPVFRKFTSWFLGHTWVWFHFWLSPLGLCYKCWRPALSIGSLCSGDHCCPNCSLWKMSVLKGLEHKVEKVVMFVTLTGQWEPAYRDGIRRGGCGLMPASCYANISVISGAGYESVLQNEGLGNI